MTAGGGAGPTPREAAESAARAILEGDLVALNQLLHPRAVAELAALGNGRPGSPSPAIGSFTVRERAHESAGPAFDIVFAGPGALARVQVSVVRGAAGWLIGRILKIDAAGAGAFS